jgi:type I restriction-modification system DNA methylase subunit
MRNVIKKLVETYKANRDHYLSPSYNETQLRTDFLNPFFEALEWDIRNISGKPTNEREVLLEEGLRANVASNVKKPDYTFRLFSERKFFVEAKKPSVKIEFDPVNAKQIRRYGFTAKLKISILSNFEHLVIYDCSQKIEEGDLVSKARIKIYHYSEYVTAFDEIKNLLGKESVYSGSFDKHWEHIEDQLKLFSVDNLFLNQINNWRLILGEEIVRHDVTINATTLNDIVQRYLNSIIFLRVCEDRSLETYQSLLLFANNEDFNALIRKFVEADRKYNAGLFNHPLTGQIIENSSSAFWKIIKQLYFPESTYSFSVFASDILGNIYEIFLGEQLVIMNGQVALEKKPEHFDRDIVTTPTFVIRDILKKTISRHCENKTEELILNSSFADIACGSGSFLLEAYQLLNDILIDYYLVNSPEELKQIAINTYKLKFETKRKILENCIFGIDKDFNAVEACKFGLLLKLLEDEDNSSIPVPALPDLSNNIHFGNSLISRSDIEAGLEEEINPFDFGEVKFDVIVGNPPYMTTEHIGELTPLEMPVYKRKYTTAFKQFDKYFLFIERGLSLLKEQGYLGYIVPNKFTKTGSGKKLRQLLRSNKCIQQIVSFGANQIFQDKTTYTCLLIIQNFEQNNLSYTEVKNIADWKVRSIKEKDYDTIDFDQLEDEVWILVPGYLKAVYVKINNQSIMLGDLVGEKNIYNGIQTSANNIYVHNASKEDQNFIYFSKDDNEWKIEKILTRPYFKTASGTDSLNTYRPFKPNAFVIYPYLKTPTGIKFVDLKELENMYPNAYAYLMAYKDQLADPKRDIQPKPTSGHEWYRYGRHQSLENCDVPAKIIVGVLSQGNKYAIDYYGTLISSGGTAGYCMITLPDSCQYSIYYIQALLNSKYLEWYSALIGEVFRGGYIARGTKVLKRLPIRVIDFNHKAEQSLHDKIAKIQESLIQLQGKIDNSSGNDRVLIPVERQFEALKNDLDKSLKQLYNLGTDDNLIPLISKIYETN